MPTVAVIGGGSWATALVKILSEGDVKVKWWLRKPEQVTYLKNFQHNQFYLSDIQFNLKKVKPDSNIKKVVTGADYVILATPSAFVSDIMSQLTPAELKGVIFVSAVKGMLPQKNKLISDYIETEFYIPQEDICIIGGPCHSEEVALEKQSYLTVACKDFNNAMQVANLLTNRFVKCNALIDVHGLEYAAILKNIIAILCGVAHGLNYGDNFQSVLVSNAMQEVKKFLDTAHPYSSRDLLGSAYLGDLLVTAYSQFSRNRTLGNMIGRGYSVKSAQTEMNMVAEGYYAVKSMIEMCKRYDVEMPIVQAVYNILYQKASPVTEIQILRNILK